MGKETQRPTVQEIARRLELSPSTVYRVLGGSQLVKDATRRRIEATAAEMGYQRRRIRRHVPRTILTIALFLPRSPDVYHRLFYDPADLLAGLAEGFDTVKTQISVSVNQPNPNLFEYKKSGNIDACVFGFTTPTEDVRALLRERSIPTIVLNRETPGCSFVSSDHLSGMRALLRRGAIGRKRVRPCYVNFTPAQSVSALRVAAFRTACRLEGVPFRDSDFIDIDSIEQIDEAMIKRLSDRYNVVFCFNDFVAVYLYQVTLIARIPVPERLGIAGYDDSPIRRLTPQRIDTISLSPFSFGKEAGRWLRRAVIEHDMTPLQTLIPGDLVTGDTLAIGNPARTA